MELRYIRDTYKREVDFVVLKDKMPEFAVECKTAEKAIAPAVYYFSERTPIPKFFQVHQGAKKFRQGKIEVLPFWDFCRETGMP